MNINGINQFFEEREKRKRKSIRIKVENGCYKRKNNRSDQAYSKKNLTSVSFPKGRIFMNL